jgi:hypothetical protein
VSDRCHNDKLSMEAITLRKPLCQRVIFFISRVDTRDSTKSIHMESLQGVKKGANGSNLLFTSTYRRLVRNRLGSYEDYLLFTSTYIEEKTAVISHQPHMLGRNKCKYSRYSAKLQSKCSQRVELCPSCDTPLHTCG